jgi:ATP-dependent DNA helicase RecQ
LTFDPSALAGEMGVPRAKIVTNLMAIAAAGDAVLATSGVRLAYRLKKDPGKLQSLADRYAELFQQRERADLARLSQVLGLASHRGCLTGHLTKHFGETLPSPCGHCDRCRGIPAVTIKRAPARDASVEEWRIVQELCREKHAELATPRQLARFLCGMSSPASTRARLMRHEAFGIFSDLPFANVLAMSEAL